MAIKECLFCIETLEKINSLDWLIFSGPFPFLKKKIYSFMERRKKKGNVRKPNIMRLGLSVFNNSFWIKTLQNLIYGQTVTVKQGLFIQPFHLRMLWPSTAFLLVRDGV